MQEAEGQEVTLVAYRDGTTGTGSDLTQATQPARCGM
jgi:hypothetical protein